MKRLSRLNPAHFSRSYPNDKITGSKHPLLPPANGPNFVVARVLLGVVTQSLKPAKSTCKRMQQPQRWWGQQCWELLRSYWPWQLVHQSWRLIKYNFKTKNWKNISRPFVVLSTGSSWPINAMQPEVNGHKIAVIILFCIFLFTSCIIRQRTSVPEIEKTVVKSGNIFGI